VPVELSEKDVEERLKAIAGLKTDYQLVFGDADPIRGPAVRRVMLDLARFCRAGQTTWSEDARHHARLEGRRETWLHIDDWLRQPEEDLLQRLVGDSYVVVKVTDEDDDG
jgi:hypothetical protein